MWPEASFVPMQASPVFLQLHSCSIIHATFPILGQRKLKKKNRRGLKTRLPSHAAFPIVVLMAFSPCGLCWTSSGLHGISCGT